MKHTLAISVATIALLLSSADASAQARHERVQISEMKSGGQVVGARIKLTLRPNGSSYKDVLIGIGPGKGGSNANYRDLASNPAKGHLLHQFPAITDLSSPAKEVTFDVKFADVPGLAPGQDIQIISAWRPKAAGSAIHAWGMTRGTIRETSYKLPGKHAQQQQMAKRTAIGNNKSAKRTNAKVTAKTTARTGSAAKTPSTTASKTSAPAKSSTQRFPTGSAKAPRSHFKTGSTKASRALKAKRAPRVKARAR